MSDTKQATADDAVTVTEVDGQICLKIRMEAEVRIPRDVIKVEDTKVVAEMVLERIECDLQMDRDGSDPNFVPIIDKKLAEHLAKG
jgi:hypothetical protein